MSALLPDVIRDVAGSHPPFEASKAFGVVVILLAIALLVERELVGAATTQAPRQRAISTVVLPLVLTIALVVAARIASLVP